MTEQDRRPAGLKLLHLTPELVENVIKRVGDRRDLSNTRLVCKTLDRYAAKELFSDVFLSPSEEHIRNWDNISQDSHLRQIPTCAIIHTQPNVEDDSGGEGEEIEEDFEHAVAVLSKFPNLDSVKIGFTPECTGEGNDDLWSDVVEDVNYRKDMLMKIFQAIQDRAAIETNRTIRKLTITNLQNFPIPDFTSSDLFRKVMSQLTELHISMTQEYNEHGPDHDYTRVELQTFPAHLCSAWLAPVAKNLRALSLYSRTDNWGPFPGYFDPGGITFPKLETLALGYYTLAHDNDIDWILTIKSLKKLILHNCMIASHIRIDSDNIREWGVRKHDWVKLGEHADNDWGESFSYSGKWSQCLDRIALNLPKLQDFRFDSGSRYPFEEDGSQYDLDYRHNCGVRIFPERYICFDNGILPTHWPEADSHGALHMWLNDPLEINVHKTTLEEDQKSLNALLKTLKLRSTS